MKWFVLEENPKPDTYIAVFRKNDICDLRVRNFSVYKNAEEALERARKLQKKYNIKSIRVFHEGGHSESLR